MDKIKTIIIDGVYFDGTSVCVLYSPYIDRDYVLPPNSEDKWKCEIKVPINSENNFSISHRLEWNFKRIDIELILEEARFFLIGVKPKRRYKTHQKGVDYNNFLLIAEDIIILERSRDRSID